MMSNLVAVIEEYGVKCHDVAYTEHGWWEWDGVIREA